LRGVRSLGFATYGARAISVLSLIVVARVLGPQEVGVAALALLIGNTLTSLSDFGLAPTIVSLGGRVSRATFLRAARYRTVFSLSGFTFVFGGAEWIASFLGAPEAGPAIRAMSFALIIGAIGFAPASSLAATRKFGVLARAYLALSLVQTTTTIGLALAGFSYWAVVLGFLAGSGAQVGTQWVLWRDRTWFGDQELASRGLLELGGLVTLSWVSLILLFTLDRAFVAGLFGTTQLGFYALAVTWGTFAADSLNQVIGTVALPTFAALADDRQAMGRAYLTSTRLIAFVSAPAAVGLVLTAPELLQLVLGGGTDKWLPSLACLQILALFGLLKSIVGSASSVLLASQNFKKYAYLIPVPVTVFLVVAFPILAVVNSIEGIAIALLLAYFVNAVLVLRALTRIFGLGRFEVLQNISGPLVAATLMGAALLPIRLGVPVSWISLAELVGLGAAVYVGCILVVGKRAVLDEFVETGLTIVGRAGRHA
jgi:lipopolysaccharide exporter